jgi:cyclin-dependent kinase 12/13
MDDKKRPPPPPPPIPSSTGEIPPPTKTNETEKHGKHNMKKKRRLKRAEEKIIIPTSERRWKLYFHDLYRILMQVGQGTYGSVFKGKQKSTNRIVALKKIQMTNEQEGFPLTALREIKALNKLKHKNIVELIEVVLSKPNDSNRNQGDVYMVFEYMEYDLSGLVDRGMCLTQAHVMCYSKQLLEAVAFMHKHDLIHRDIKGANLLVNRQNVLKLADMGLARVHANKRTAKSIKSSGDDPKKIRQLKQKLKPYTNRVVTLWYRPPELLLGEIFYGSEIDIWGVGCLFAEWIYGDPILPGNNEIEQMKLIFNLCGTPTLENWPDHEDKKKWKSDAEGWCRANKKASTLEDRFRRFRALELDLVKKMLTLNPSKRCSAFEAINHDYFKQTGMNQCPKPEEYVVDKNISLSLSLSLLLSFIHSISLFQSSSYCTRGNS